MGVNPQYGAGEVIANKFVVDRLLGESPVGQIYLATESFSSQKICIKSYRPEISTLLLAAPDFFLKAATMTEIEHDNLAPCLDIQEEMGRVFVARHFVEGESFSDWLKKNRSQPNYFPRGLELLWQICQGLTAIHERARHLNIHPGNIIVGNSVAKLVDWDPRALSSSEMNPDSLPIRPEFQGYRAPEASSGNSFLSYPSTDLFAVAGLLFRLIKGAHPTHLTDTLRDIRGFDKDLAVFLAKAMHPRPEERFQEAGSFSDAIWDLKPAMQRLQDLNVQTTPSGYSEPLDNRRMDPVPPKVDPFFASPSPSHGFDDIFPPKEPTLFGQAPSPNHASPAGFPPATPSEDDSFFQFFPPAEASIPVPPPSKHAPKSGGDTLFGSPSFQSETPAYKPPTQNFPPPQKSGLESLESSGTLFGSQAPLFSSPPKGNPRVETPKSAPAKPLAVSLSSLEKDPLDLAGGNATAGFTQFGFKGAGENRTGIFTPEQKAASTKAKLILVLASFGILILAVGLVVLFVYLRRTATPEGIESPSGIAAAIPDPDMEDDPPPATDPTPPEPEPPEPEPSNPPPEQQAPPPPPRPEKPPEPTPVQSQSGFSVSPERLAALMNMVQTRTWPETAAERLRAADDFNDLGKTAEANLAYGKSLAASDATEKQKILALGGLAVTFQSMGMNDQAKDAVQRILDINPKNGFALKLKEKLK